VLVIDIEPIRERFSAVDERRRRLVAAAEPFAAGYGGIAAVAMATGVAPSTIGRGLKELAGDEPSERIRRPGQENDGQGSHAAPRSRGAGRADDAGWSGVAVAVDLQIVRHLAEGAASPGSRGKPHLVAQLLSDMGYSLQGNRKTTEGDSHPDRDAQFG